MAFYSDELNRAIQMRRTFLVLRQGVEYILTDYPDLTDDGSIEVLLYCMSIADLKPDVIEVMAKSLWESQDDPWKSTWESEKHTIDFFKRRVAYYKSERRHLALEPKYTPMKIYNTFFLNPLTKDTDDLSDFDGDIFKLMRFEYALKSLDKFMKEIIKEEL